MSLADPQSVDIGAGAVLLPRVSVGPYQAEYLSADGNLGYRISHDIRNRIRSVARIDVRKVAQDPLFPVQNAPFTMSAYLVVDSPLFGYTGTELEDAAAGLMTNLTATTNANLIKLVHRES